MKKKLYSLLIVLILLFQLLSPSVLYVSAREVSTKQPEVCNGPSATMSLYFEFQNRVMSLVLGGELGERIFSTSTRPGLFSEDILTLTHVTILDVVASSVWGNLKSTVSTASTSVVLLMLASLSVLQSNTEGLAILFKDRPIVRDYKSLLDIESSLMEIAYFSSQKINLLNSVDEKFLKDFQKLIQEYQSKGLLEKNGTVLPNGSLTVADLLSDMIVMNAYMKHFLLYHKGLGGFKGCMGGAQSQVENCPVVLKFSNKAIETLKNDYKGIGMFGACNKYASNFKNTINKTVKNNSQDMKVAIQDVKDSLVRLKGAFFGGGRWNLLKDRCNMTDYEMAQLGAYWGGDWECNQGLVDLNVSVPVDYTSLKKAQRDQKKKDVNTTRDANEKNKGNNDSTVNEVKKESTVQKRQLKWSNLYGTSTLYDSEFSFDLHESFVSVYNSIMEDYRQTQENASSSDLSYELKKIRGLIDEVGKVEEQAQVLETTLKDIAEYQCSDSKK